VYTVQSVEIFVTQVPHNFPVVLISRLLLITSQVLIETIDSEGYTPVVKKITSGIAWRNEIPIVFNVISLETDLICLWLSGYL